MRTTDQDSSINNAPRGPVLGEKVEQPKPAAPASAQKPVGPSGIVTDQDGRKRTTSHPTYY